MYFAGHAHSYSRFDASAYGDGATHITVGGAGCDEMPFPQDQMDNDVTALKVGTSCTEWCARAEIREGYAEQHVPKDPCMHCAVGPLGLSPVYFSDKMAIGLVQISGKSLTFSLLRAPDGLVLDTVTLTKP